jgi:hypothetical protein
MKFVGHVPRIREGEMHTYVWSGYLKGREYLEDLAVDGRIILKRFYINYMGRYALETNG